MTHAGATYSMSSRASQRVGAKRRPMTGSARPRTHNHRCQLFSQRSGHSSLQQRNPVVMGPCFGRDDTGMGDATVSNHRQDPDDGSDFLR
ncbi:hypothetical protein ABIF38_001277 [Bradyrhizobium japonicum]|uniref:Uncharacterized protein n=1 Tax=Bradyrhizobium elkanii TaxID=29448 RepID=A0ABV4FGX5_BRAEL|nr:hypothetical protein [Bradyrhizobium elkanii]MCP1736405.1 hypothetical protein [Bradyrhizobium elkanii]MCP1754303.1 hypothetical protein [Bradyrhizobium elkanii]MCP1979823.1 hypothetical protein [Bradyrhizobium elkanii]MCS3571746.1 hypothetical protein [Bradyrhizobium elkanii]